VALSGDGKHVLTGSEDNTAILWEAASGKKLQTFQGAAVALSGDSKYAVTGSADNTVILWESASGKKLRTFNFGFSGLGTVALSDDDKHVVNGSGELLQRKGVAVLWDAASGKLLQVFQHTGLVLTVALSGDGKQLVTWSFDATILWESASGKKLQTFQGHLPALSADGKSLWTVSEDNSIRLWDVTTGKERCRLYSFDGSKDWLVVTPDGRFDGSAGAWQFVTYREPDTLKVRSDDATRKRFHRPGLLSQVWKGEK